MAQGDPDPACGFVVADLRPAQADLQDRVGTAVALSGDTALVGAPNAAAGPIDRAGAAFVFSLRNGEWVEQATLLANDAQSFARFGNVVALDGDTAVVAAPIQGVNGDLYVFRRTSNTWVQEAKLTPTGAAADEQFGAALSLEGNTLAVGSPPKDGVDGAVYVFERQGSTWQQTARLGPDASEDETGRAVSLSGNTLLATAGIAFEGTRIYEYRRAGTQWELEDKLTDPAGSASYFGRSLELQGDVLLIGTPNFSGTSHAGSVYFYERVEGFLLPIDQFSANDADSSFGSVVALDGSRAAVSAPEADGDQGAVYVFERDEFEWIEIAKLSIPRDAQAGPFGSALDVSGDVVLTGSGLEDDPESDIGAARIWGLAGLPFTYCTPKPNSLGCLPRIEFSGAPSASATDGFQVRGVDIRNQKAGLLLYGLNGRSAIPFQGGTLCVAAPLQRSVPVHSGGNPPPFNDCSGVLRIDMNAFAAGALGGNPRPELQIAGSLVHAQWWGRDFGGAFNSMLSDAIEYAICN